MPDKKLQLLVIGDTTTDVFMELKDASLIKRPEKRGDALCLRFGDKVAVESVLEVEGTGNAANVAIGCSRLGLKTALWTVLGNDDDGKRTARDIFKPENIAPGYIVFDQKNRTNYSLVLNYKAERTILGYHAPRNYKFPADIKNAEWLYLTSMGQGWELILSDLFSYVEKNGSKIIFNPGTYQLKTHRETLAKILEKTYIFFSNKEEALKIAGLRDGSIEQILSEMKELGPRMVVITDGDKGAFASDGKNNYRMPIVESPVVERTGCGDSFAAGFIAGLKETNSVKEALKWGAVNSSSVIQHVGAREGLLSHKDLLERIGGTNKSAGKFGQAPDITI